MLCLCLLSTNRFTAIGGPSFYISFLGQDNLYGTLEVNATFDPTLDWSVATPELAYWDIGKQKKPDVIFKGKCVKAP